MFSKAKLITGYVTTAFLEVRKSFSEEDFRIVFWTTLIFKNNVNCWNRINDGYYCNLPSVVRKVPFRYIRCGLWF